MHPNHDHAFIADHHGPLLHTLETPRSFRIHRWIHTYYIATVLIHAACSTLVPFPARRSGAADVFSDRLLEECVLWVRRVRPRAVLAGVGEGLLSLGPSLDSRGPS